MSSSLLIMPSRLRSESITKVARLLGSGPMRFTPKSRAIFCFGSESSGYPRSYLSSKAFWRSTASALIPLGRCDAPARYDIELDVEGPACVFLVASDPTEGAFRQLPVSLGAPCDSVAPPE